MICFQTAKRLFGKVIYTPRGYIVPRADGRILVGATVEDVGFDKSVTESGTEILLETALEIRRVWRIWKSSKNGLDCDRSPLTACRLSEILPKSKTFLSLPRIIATAFCSRL
jgi:glycine/D-amino acid oxidase-like deaminating enzyme